MILSDVSIQDAIRNDRLEIDPQPSPVSGDDSRYQTTAVDLTLGDELSWLKREMPVNVDLRQGKFKQLFATNCHSRVLREDDPYVLQPGHLVLGKTHERVHLPITNETGPWLAARVEGRSSYARCGLLVHFTAPTIHAGFNGTITLEIINHGPYPVLLHPRNPICQLIIEQVDSRPLGRLSQFQDQSTPVGTN